MASWRRRGSAEHPHQFAPPFCTPCGPLLGARSRSQPSQAALLHAPPQPSPASCKASSAMSVPRCCRAARARCERIRGLRRGGWIQVRVHLRKVPWWASYGPREIKSRGGVAVEVEERVKNGGSCKAEVKGAELLGGVRVRLEVFEIAATKDDKGAEEKQLLGLGRAVHVSFIIYGGRQSWL